MPLLAGSVSINAGTGAATGAGLAKEAYDALAVAFAVSPAQVPGNVPGAQQQLAKLANVFAQVTIAHLLANNLITVPTGIAVSTAGSASAQTGATTAPAIATLARSSAVSLTDSVVNPSTCSSRRRV